MVKNCPVAAPALAPLAADCEPLRLAAPPMANEPLLPWLIEVVVLAEPPTVPPGVVCWKAPAAPWFWEAPEVVPAVAPRMALAPTEVEVELDWPPEAAPVVPVPKVRLAAIAGTASTAIALASSAVLSDFKCLSTFECSDPDGTLAPTNQSYTVLGIGHNYNSLKPAFTIQSFTADR